MTNELKDADYDLAVLLQGMEQEDVHPDEKQRCLMKGVYALDAWCISSSYKKDDIDEAFQLMRKLAIVDYKGNNMGDATFKIKVWRTFSKLLRDCHQDVQSAAIVDFCNLLMIYCRDGLGSIYLEKGALTFDVQQFVTQQSTTLKLLSFFTEKLAAVVSYYVNDFPCSVTTTALSLLVQFFVLTSWVGECSEELAALHAKSYDYVMAAAGKHHTPTAGQPKPILLCCVESSVLDTTFGSAGGHQVALGVAQISIEAVARLGRAAVATNSVGALAAPVSPHAAIYSHIFTFVYALHSVCVDFCGDVSDKEVHSAVKDMAAAVALVLAHEMASRVENIMVSNDREY